MITLTRLAWGRRIRRLFAAALMGAVALAPVLTAQAQETKSVNELKDRLDVLQEELDASVTRIEALVSRRNTLLFEVGQTELKARDVGAEREEVERRAIAAARRLYMADGSDTLEILLSAQSIADLTSQYEAMAQLSELDRIALADLQRIEEQSLGLQEDLSAKSEALIQAGSRLEEESARLQARFREATAEYKKRQAELAAARDARAPQAGGLAFTRGGMTCPVAGPNSFIDSWGYPRSGGRTHKGTDIMAASGAPVVAITDGRITFEGYGTTAGKWLILSGDDGHSYWYMHNKENLVSGGRVRAGEQIATVGDTGNAIGGPPHVHFEYHPGGGGPVNPYPMLAKVCRGAQ